MAHAESPNKRAHGKNSCKMECWKSPRNTAHWERLLEISSEIAAAEWTLVKKGQKNLQPYTLLFMSERYKSPGYDNSRCCAVPNIPRGWNFRTYISRFFASATRFVLKERKLSGKDKFIDKSALVWLSPSLNSFFPAPLLKVEKKGTLCPQLIFWL